MCLRDQSVLHCTHPECHSLYSPDALNPSKMMASLVSMLFNRQSMLTNLLETTKSLLDKTETLKSQKLDPKPADSSKAHPFLQQCKYEYKLVALYPVLNTVFKEKGFSLALQVQDSNLNSLAVSEVFKVKLYSSENPPKLLKLNISSKKIMRGTIEACMNSEKIVNFENLVINEVSSHYYNETFTLVVACENSSIRPFVLENLSVRARNFHKKDKFAAVENKEKRV